MSSENDGVLTVEKIRAAVKLLKAAQVEPSNDGNYFHVPNHWFVQDGEVGNIEGVTFVESQETEEDKMRREAIEYNIAQRPVRKKKVKPSNLAIEVMEYWHKETMKRIYKEMFDYSDRYKDESPKTGTEIKYLTYQSSPPK